MSSRQFLLAIVMVALTSGCQSSKVKNPDSAPMTPPSAVNTAGDETKSSANAALTESEAIKAIAKKSASEDSVNDLQVKLIDKNGKTVDASKAPTIRDGKEITKVSTSASEKEAQAAHSKLMAATSAVAEQTEAIAQQHGDTLGARHMGSVSAAKALGWLKNGNRRFTKGYFRTDGANAKDRLRLISGQKPHATVFSCSDSRVPPEIVLDQKLGEIYVVRTSGKVLNANTISGIEYAVQFLGTNLVVLLGHENCNASDENVQAAILEQSKIIRDAVSTGDVKVTSALYHLDTGIIDWK